MLLLFTLKVVCEVDSNNVTIKLSPTLLIKINHTTAVLTTFLVTAMGGAQPVQKGKIHTRGREHMSNV